jgi:hypothetical protein
MSIINPPYGDILPISVPLTLNGSNGIEVDLANAPQVEKQSDGTYLVTPYDTSEATVMNIWTNPTTNTERVMLAFYYQSLSIDPIPDYFAHILGSSGQTWGNGTVGTPSCQAMNIGSQKNLTLALVPTSSGNPLIVDDPKFEISKTPVRPPDSIVPTPVPLDVNDTSLTFEGGATSCTVAPNTNVMFTMTDSDNYVVAVYADSQPYLQLGLQQMNTGAAGSTYTLWAIATQTSTSGQTTNIASGTLTVNVSS